MKFLTLFKKNQINTTPVEIKDEVKIKRVLEKPVILDDTIKVEFEVENKKVYQSPVILDDSIEVKLDEVKIKKVLEKPVILEEEEEIKLLCTPIKNYQITSTKLRNKVMIKSSEELQIISKEKIIKEINKVFIKTNYENYDLYSKELAELDNTNYHFKMLRINKNTDYLEVITDYYYNNNYKSVSTIKELWDNHYRIEYYKIKEFLK